jgi:hypothetical protein
MGLLLLHLQELVQLVVLTNTEHPVPHPIITFEVLDD